MCKRDSSRVSEQEEDYAEVDQRSRHQSKSSWIEVVETLGRHRSGGIIELGSLPQDCNPILCTKKVKNRVRLDLPACSANAKSTHWTYH